MRLMGWGAAALAALGGVWAWQAWGSRPPPPPAAARPPAVSASRRAQAAEMEARARRLVADRAVSPGNLSEAIRLLTDCKDLLQPQAERDPAPYVAVREALRHAMALRDRAVRDLWVDYERRRHLGDLDGARASLRLIARTVPDPGDPDGRRARAELARQIAPAADP